MVHSATRLDVVLGRDVVLTFVNAQQDADCLTGSNTAACHFHGDSILFVDSHGYYIELTYLEVVAVLISGDVLVREQWINGQLRLRSLVHRIYNGETWFMEAGEEIRLRSCASTGRRRPHAARSDPSTGRER